MNSVVKRRLLRTLGPAFALVLVLAASGPVLTSGATPTLTPPNFKVAFIGDQGLGSGARAVLQLIRDEGTDMVLHQGDFDYQDDPVAWDQQISDVLGPDFPYFASIGNHEVDDLMRGEPSTAWPGYQQVLQARLDRVEGAVCTGDLGVKSACTYQGLFFILSGVGVLDDDGQPDPIGSPFSEAKKAQGAYIASQLAADSSTWRICSWHRNQRLYQTFYEFFANETGWWVYEECRKGGAIIATAHQHGYGRTHLMDNFEDPSIASTSNTLQIDKGKTFAFISGLGGLEVQPEDDELAANPWWAVTYTANQSANFGALFCIFNENGIQNRAHCYFKDIDGVIVDEFDVVAAASELPVAMPTPVTPVVGDFPPSSGLLLALTILGSVLVVSGAYYLWHTREEAGS